MANGMNGGLPPWARFISLVGVPSAIAMYLVYVLSVGMSNSLESHEAEHAREMRVLTRLIQQLCVNTADNLEDRAGCFPGFSGDR
mgnify:CR=1 FL=1